MAGPIIADFQGICKGNNVNYQAPIVGIHKYNRGAFYSPLKIMKFPISLTGLFAGSNNQLLYLVDPLIIYGLPAGWDGGIGCGT